MMPWNLIGLSFYEILLSSYDATEFDRAEFLEILLTSYDAMEFVFARVSPSLPSVELLASPSVIVLEIGPLRAFGLLLEVDKMDDG